MELLILQGSKEQIGAVAAFAAQMSDIQVVNIPPVSKKETVAIRKNDVRKDVPTAWQLEMRAKMTPEDAKLDAFDWLRKIAENGRISHQIPDPTAWQREVRSEDRVLYGRD
jgi:Asp-tRNA(Asn)/Glu-tRNA(Gln) amidotransferase C subunit